MGRMAMGKEARSEIISIRITEDQRLMLEAIYGTAAKGLYAIMLVWIAEKRKGN